MGTRLVIGKLVFIMILVVSSGIGCKPTNHQPLKKVHSTVSAEDFDTFYDRFHRDTLFQLSRTPFPLEGTKVNGSEDLSWTKANWRCLKTKIQDVDTTQYRIEYLRSDTTFNEKVWIENSGYFSEYRFALVDNKWSLVFAVEQDL